MSSKSLIFRACWLTLKTRISLLSLKASHILLQIATYLAYQCRNMQQYRCFSWGTAHSNIEKKLNQKRKKAVFGWQIIKKCTFSASDRSKTFKNGQYARFHFQKEVWGKTKSSKKLMKFSIFRHSGTVEISCFQKKPRERCRFAFKCRYSVK